MKKFLIALTFLILFAAMPVSVKSQGRNSIGLQVSPTQYNVSLNTGEKKIFDFALWQDTGLDLSLSVKIKTFQLIKNNEDLVINEDPDELLTSWIRLTNTNITLKNEQVTAYSAEVTIPENTPSGSYNLALVFAVSSPDVNQPNVAAINYRIVVPIIVTAINKVLGISENASITKLDAIPLISFDGSLMIDAEVTNSGSTHVIPRGVLEIENLWGTNKVENLGINSEKKIVTSNSIRKFDTMLQTLPFGRYKVTLNIVYGLNNKVIELDTYFYVIPWWIVFIAFGIFSFTLYRVWRVRKIKIRKFPDKSGFASGEKN